MKSVDPSTRIPSITLRADNAFAVPLLEQYAAACRRYAEEYPLSHLLQRARDADELVVRFRDWQDRHPHKVKMERTLGITDPGKALRETRRKLRETERALAREQHTISAQVTEERRARRALETEVRQLHARAKQAGPDQHVTAEPTTR